MRHAEVAPDVLLGLGALLLADEDERAPVKAREAGHDGRIVAEQSVAMQLDDVGGHQLEELEGVRSPHVPGVANTCPGGLPSGRDLVERWWGHRLRHARPHDRAPSRPSGSNLPRTPADDAPAAGAMATSPRGWR